MRAIAGAILALSGTIAACVVAGMVVGRVRDDHVGVVVILGAIALAQVAIGTAVVVRHKER
jgi:hypothetical protein